VDPGLRRLEEVALNASATPRQLLHDGWLVRLSPGKAKRARSVNAFFASSLPLDDKLAWCEALYASRQLPLLFRITPFVSPPQLDAELEARGFARFEPTHVMTRDLTGWRTCGAEVAAERCDVDAFVAAVSALRGAVERDVAAHAERLRALPLAVDGFVMRDRGTPVCTGLLVVEPPYAGIFDVVTAEVFRGRGLASRLTSVMLDRAAAAGATTAYLQVAVDNDAALAVYRKHGFVERYRYWYRARP
jgi:ribosomal protein S18 acetylase RimI-like enzyme